MTSRGTILAQGLTDRLAVDGAAQYLGLSASTLNKMRHQGRGPRFLRLGGRVFYRKPDLELYLQSSVVETQDSRNAA